VCAIAQHLVYIAITQVTGRKEVIRRLFTVQLFNFDNLTVAVVSTSGTGDTLDSNARFVTSLVTDDLPPSAVMNAMVGLGGPSYLALRTRICAVMLVNGHRL